MGQLKVDLIGAGSFGGELAAVIRDLEEIRLNGVYSRRPESARALAARYDGVAYERLDEMLEQSGGQAVLIVTPHHTHRDLVVAAAEGGRHIFCEKSMALTVDECHDMVEAADRNGVKLMVGHKRRLRPQYAYIKQVLESGDLGQPVAGNVLGFHWRVYQKATQWFARRREVGGLLHWAGTHDIDTLRFLFGEVESAFALEGPKLRDNTDYADSLSALLRFRNGMVVTLEISPYFPLFSYRRAFSYQFVCERGGIWYDPIRTTVEYQVGEGPRTVRTFDDWGFEVAFAAELRSFAGWVVRDEPPVVTAEDGLRCVEIMQAIYISAASGRQVHLPLDRHERGPWG